MDLRRIIWLASFPKSGNTWTRSFLAHALMPPGEAPDINNLRRFTTADVRQDFYDAAAGGRFQGAGIEDWLAIRPKALARIAASKPSLHFVKTHCRIDVAEGPQGPQPLIPPEVTAAAVYVMRNPFDVALSYARHLNLDVDGAIGNMAFEGAMNVTQSGIFEVIGRWDAHVASWTGAPGLPRHVMRYEDMIADPERAFRALLAFLKVDVKDGRLRRAIRATSFQALKRQEREKGFVERPPHLESFFAKGRAHAWREELTPAQVAKIRAAFLPVIERWYPDLAAETAAVAGAA